MATALLLDNAIYTQHITGEGHPERPERLQAVKDALDRLGKDGEGVSVTVASGKDQRPTVEAGGWIEWGKRDQFGVGGAVQVAKDAWAWLVGFKWKP